jgi:hypothetical protein
MCCCRLPHKRWAYKHVWTGNWKKQYRYYGKCRVTWVGMDAGAIVMSLGGMVLDAYVK